MRKEFKYLTIWSEASDPDILFNSYSSRLEIDINIARELIANRLEFTGGRPVYVLIDFSQVKSVTKEARDFMNSQEGGLNGILGGAFLSSNVVAKLFINLFLKVWKPTIPARFFTNKEDALNWLLKIKSEQLQYAQMINI